MFRRVLADWIPAASGDAVRPQPASTVTSVAEHIFSKHFELVRANTPALQEVAHRLRYRIYCEENPFESKDQHPNGLEQDRFDSHAHHVLLRYRGDGGAGGDSFIGVVRVVLPSGRPGDCFPVQSAINHPFFDNVHALRQYCEISRLGVVEPFRNAHRTKFVVPGLSLSNLAPIGLIRGAVEESLHHGVGNAVLIVKDNLRQSLERIGARHYETLGEPVEHKGLRQALAVNYTQNFLSIRQKCPRIWAVISRDGALENRSREIDLKKSYSYVPAPYFGA